MAERSKSGAIPEDIQNRDMRIVSRDDVRLAFLTLLSLFLALARGSLLPTALQEFLDIIGR
jgi:hypothetical protein